MTKRAIKYRSIAIKCFGEEELSDNAIAMRAALIKHRWAALSEEERAQAIRLHEKRESVKAARRLGNRLEEVAGLLSSQNKSDNVRVLSDAWPQTLPMNLAPYTVTYSMPAPGEPYNEYRIAETCFGRSPRELKTLQAISFAGDVKEEDLLAIVADRLGAFTSDSEKIAAARRHVNIALNLLHQASEEQLQEERPKLNAEQQDELHAWTAFGPDGVLMSGSTVTVNEIIKRITGEE